MNIASLWFKVIIKLAYYKTLFTFVPVLMMVHSTGEYLLLVLFKATTVFSKSVGLAKAKQASFLVINLVSLD